MNRWVLMLGLVLGTSAQAAPLTLEQKVSDLNQLTQMIQAGYGPLQYKAKTMGVQLDALSEKYLDEAKKTRTNGEFYYLVRKYIAEFKDSHFGGYLPTDHAALLGFSTDLVDGRVLIDRINRQLLTIEKFPFERGDELVELDGKSAQQWVNDIAPYVNMGFEQSAKRVAASWITIRAGRALPVPTGAVQVKIRRGTSNVIKTLELNWVVVGTPGDENDKFTPARLARQRQVRFNENYTTNYDNISIFDLWNIDPRKNSEADFRCSGKTRIERPEGSESIIEEPFVAYKFSSALGKMGYLRIPHYMPVNEVTGAPEFELRFRQYEYVISELEKDTVGLIIDQDHNCGGSVDYLERMLGLFMDRPYSPMMFTLLANKEEYLSFKSWWADLKLKNTLGYQYGEKTINLIKQSWIAGDFMTPKTSLSGRTELFPNQVRYSKPVVMLIDELSGSGGDAFPAMMQGYGRAKLIGTRTMGAGGHIVAQPALHYSQVAIRMTKSLFFRPDGVEVENNGAAPDYPYTITRDDFVYGYVGYRDFAIQKLSDLIRAQ